MIEFKKIEGSSDPLFAPMFELYHEAFPPSERRTLDDLTRILDTEPRFTASALMREGQFRNPSGCAVTGIIDRSGRRMSGECMIRSISVMHDRSNGLGGGFACRRRASAFWHIVLKPFYFV